MKLTRFPDVMVNSQTSKFYTIVNDNLEVIPEDKILTRIVSTDFRAENPTGIVERFIAAEGVIISNAYGQLNAYFAKDGTSTLFAVCGDSVNCNSMPLGNVTCNGFKKLVREAKYSEVKNFGQLRVSNLGHLTNQMTTYSSGLLSRFYQVYTKNGKVMKKRIPYQNILFRKTSDYYEHYVQIIENEAMLIYDTDDSKFYLVSASGRFDQQSDENLNNLLANNTEMIASNVICDHINIALGGVFSEEKTYEED